MFVDLDQEIERASSRTVSAIFGEYGEEEFRDVEAVALSVAASVSDAVIALGAGALEADDNFELVRESGTLVYLRANVDLLAKRAVRLQNRPLLAGVASTDEMRTLLMRMLEQREPRYVFADVVVDMNEGDSVDQVVSLVLRELAEQ
jgi:shikimate kinase